MLIRSICMKASAARERRIVEVLHIYGTQIEGGSIEGLEDRRIRLANVAMQVRSGEVG
jgi:hypothetical protein